MQDADLSIPKLPQERKYVILRDSNIQSLSNKVNENITKNKGILIGGVSMMGSFGYQAMTIMVDVLPVKKRITRKKIKV